MNHFILYGGSYDPPTLAHIGIAKLAMKKTNSVGVIFMPTSQSPHKNKANASNQHRIKMLEIALEGFSWAQISTIEIDRGGISYTIDTMETLMKDGLKIQLLIGADQWSNFKAWHRYEELLDLGNPIIMPRHNIKIPKDRALSDVDINCSSTEARNAIKNGYSTQELLNPKVLTYISKHGLYIE